MLKLTDIAKRFDQATGEPLNVLCGASLSVMRRDIVALIGPNGCGKSTLLNLIAGDIQPDSGTIELNGRDLLTWPTYRRCRLIGRVHQDSYKAIAGDLSVGEILAIAGRRGRSLSLGFPNSKAALAVLQDISPGVARFVAERERFLAAGLSGGQRQLLALAIAVLGSPYVLLLDEHTTSLDEQYRLLADELVQQFVRRFERSAVVAVHDYDWVLATCSVVADMREGRIYRREK